MNEEWRKIKKKVRELDTSLSIAIGEILKMQEEIKILQNKIKTLEEKGKWAR